MTNPPKSEKQIKHAPGGTGPPQVRALRPAGAAGSRVAESLIVLAVGIAMVRFIHGGSQSVAGRDSFYHVKMAAMIPEYGILHEFPWLQFTYFTDEGRAFVNHHYGFHVLLAPLVRLSHALTGEYLPGGRWAIALLFGLAVMLLDRLLLVGGVRWRWIWLVVLVFMPFQFFTRQTYIRAICPSLVFMLLLLLTMFRRRHVWTALVIAAYTHLYLGGVLYAPVLVGLYVLASMLTTRDGRRIPWRLICWAAGGWLVGVLTHPYLGGMAEFLRLQVFGSGLSPDISVGREWKPYKDLWWFAQMSGVALVIWSIALCVRLRESRPAGVEELTLLLGHFVFLGLTLKARRFIEYWPVFCLLSSAYMSAPFWRRLADRCEKRADSGGRLRSTWLRRGGAAVMIALTLVVVRATPIWREIRNNARGDFDLSAVRAAMRFLQRESQPGDIVFTDDWDIFPLYFYYNTHNHYIVGLDPKFTHARRPVLWKRYVKVSRGEVPATVSVTVHDESGQEREEQVSVTLEDIREHFHARYVITDPDHKRLAGKLAADEDFATLIYPSTSYAEARDAPFVIFRVEGRRSKVVYGQT